VVTQYALRPKLPVELETLSDRQLLIVIAKELDELRAAWQKWEPVLEAFQRGGILAAQRAAKNGGRRGT